MEEKKVKEEEKLHTIAGGNADAEGNRYHMEFRGDPKLCTCCGQCARVCPVECITVTEISAVINQSECLSCGTCADACPVGACDDVPVYEW